MKPSAETCAGCGRTLSAGSAECPNCSKATALESEPVRGSSTDLSKQFPLESPLYECVPCERFVEAQNHHGRVVVPRFCPWCGGEVLSLIGKEMDGYRIDRVLAEGGFGVLYLASNLAEGKMKVVVKFLRPQMGYLRPELVRVFVEEARLTEEIGRTCWNVVRVHNVRDKPWPYFLEEYIRGTTLQEAIDSEDDGSMDLEECKGYLRGMAKALAATHEYGRVHRDLKPQNVMVIEGKDLPENRVKLLDFGLSLKIAGANNSLTLQRLSASSSGEPSRSPLEVAGTPEYMPPEAFDGMNDFTGDIYSFGVTAYEVLTGQAPWDEPPPGVDRFFYWRDCHKSKPPKPLRELRPDAPNWLAKVIARCLEKDKARRIGTAHELLSQLREPIPRWVKPVSAAAVLCVAVLAYFAFVTPPSEQPLDFGRAAGIVGSTLWISRAEDLASRRIVAKLPPGGTVRSCEASDPRMIAELSMPDTVEITFARGEDLRPLIGREVAITGTGEMNGDSIRIKSNLIVHLDAARPRIASPVGFRREASGEPEALHPELRLRSSVRLSLEVEEDHPAGARLKAERLEAVQGPQSIDGELEKSDGGRVLYTFALPAESAAYAMKIEAFDHAGNQDATPRFELTVDNEVELTLQGMDRQSYLAAGKAFYEVETHEVLTGFEARSSRERRLLETILYEHPRKWGELSSLQLAKLIARGQLGRIETPDVSAGHYLLAVKPGTVEDAPFELHARDKAIPENQLTGPRRPVLLGYTPPERPRAEDILEVSVEFAGLVALRRSPVKDGAEFRLPRPRNATTVKKVLINVTADRFQSASCSVFSGPEETPGGEPPASESDGSLLEPLWQGECNDIESTRIIFSPGNNLLLGENRETKFVVTLGDALGATQRATLILSTDTRPPPLEVEVTSARRAEGYFDVTRWDDLKLQVGSNETLLRATASLQGKDLPPAASSARTNAREFLFEFPRDVKCADGHYTVRVEGTDLAGNRTPRDASFVIDGRGPAVSLVGDDSGPSGTMQLTSDELALRITDGNGLRYEDAQLSIEHWAASRKTTEEIPIHEPADGSSDHALSLNGLEIPPVCRGEITVRIADALGKRTLWKKPFEMRRARPNLLPSGWAHGLEWVKVQVGEREIYITRYEVSMGAYNAPGFIENGSYVDAELVKRIGRNRPRFWVEGKSPLPYCELDDGTKVDGDGFPVVGITPFEAEAFAKRFGAQLPAWEEWQAAACPTNHLRRYPWREMSEGRLCAHVKALDLKNSPFAGARSGKWYTREGSRMPGFHPVKVSFDVSRALAQELLGKLDFKNELFHMIGNVGELVRYHEKSGSDTTYRVAGGDFNTQYHLVSIQQDVVNPMEDRTPNAYTGFRMVAPADEAFVSKLRSVPP